MTKRTTLVEKCKRPREGGKAWTTSFQVVGPMYSWAPALVGHGGHAPTLKIIRVGIAHPEFPSLEIIWVTTAHPGFCAKTVLYYDK